MIKRGLIFVFIIFLMGLVYALSFSDLTQNDFNNGKLLIPVIGTIEVAPLGMIAKAITGKDKILFGYNDVNNEIEKNLKDESNTKSEVKKDSINDKPIPAPVDNDTPIPAPVDNDTNMSPDQEKSANELGL